MSITNMLPNAVLVNQLNEPTSDKQVDENKNWNCVPASLSEAIHVLTGKTIYGDALKDAVYGQGYTGAQAPAHYVAYLASALGITMSPINAGVVGLVAALHTQLAAGHPCLVTIPSLWGIPVSQQKPGYTTHVVCMEGWGPGWLRAGNVWGAFWHDGTDDYWAQRLCYGQIWTLTRSTPPMAWVKQANGTGKDDKGHVCGEGDMTYIAAHNLAGSNGLMSEMYYADGHSFLPLDNGHIVTWDGTSVAEDGAQALVAVWQQLQAAQQKTPPPAPADPLAQKALAQLTSLNAFLKEL